MGEDSGFVLVARLGDDWTPRLNLAEPWLNECLDAADEIEESLSKGKVVSSEMQLQDRKDLNNGAIAYSSIISSSSSSPSQ